MRRLILGIVLALCLPASAQAGVRVSAFFYPWYGTVAHDGAYRHWSQHGHDPPNDIASSYYPARGLYSSTDQLVMGQQMDEIRSAGIDEIVVSWWGQGSPEDQALPAVIVAARADGISVAVHLEPYGGRTVSSTVADIAYLRNYGITSFYVYRPFDLPVSDWAAAKTALHAGGVRLLAQTAMVGDAAKAGFDGVYTYDIVTYGGNMFHRFCAQAHAQHLVCAPSVGPGYDAQRGSDDPRVKPRRNGATYDAMWHAAIARGADEVDDHVVQRVARGNADRAGRTGSPPRGLSLSVLRGAWGLHGAAAENAYLDRTRYWSDVFRSTSPVQLKTRAS